MAALVECLHERTDVELAPPGPVAGDGRTGREPKRRGEMRRDAGGGRGREGCMGGLSAQHRRLPRRLLRFEQAHRASLEGPWGKSERSRLGRWPSLVLCGLLTQVGAICRDQGHGRDSSLT